jgi:UDP-2-acetamido-2,6-beta-L-arabino-hexul-4-ose reductase
MNSQVKIEPVEYFSDSRGLVLEPIAEKEIAAQRNVHIVLTEPGNIRGNHYHESCTETFVVVGPALVRLRGDGALRDVPVPEGKALRFTVPPRISHAIQNVGSRSMLMACFSTAPHDHAQPDTVRDVLITT